MRHFKKLFLAVGLMLLSQVFLVKKTIAQTAWSTTGNANIGSSNFIGPTTDVPLYFKIGGTPAGSLSSYNTFFGKQCGSNTSLGSNNTALGISSFYSNTTGLGNIAVGYGSLYSNTTAGYNLAVGYAALYSNTTGLWNTATGYNSLYANITGNYNTAYGFYSLPSSTGNYNLGLGFKAGWNLTSGSNNIAIGDSANLQSPTASNQLNIGNVIFGTGLTGSSTAPAGNIGIGIASPLINLEFPGGAMIGTTATVNNNQHDVSNRGTKISFGATVTGLLSAGFAGMNIINVAGTNGCGNSSDIVFNTWECQTANSREVVRINGTGNMGIGTSTPHNKLEITQGSSGNSGLRFTNLLSTNYAAAAATKFLTVNATGDVILDSINAGSLTNAGSVNSWSTTGNANIGSSNFIGPTTDVPLYFKIAGNQVGALSSSNTFFGKQCGSSTSSGTDNVGLGMSSLQSNTTGVGNVAIGDNALYLNTTANNNTAVGLFSLYYNTTGLGNTTTGASSLSFNTTGNYNTAYGFNSLVNSSNGNYNLGLGFKAGVNLTSGSNNIAIGDSTNLASATGSNQLNIGNAIFGTGLTGSVTAPAGNIGIGTTSPTARLTVAGGDLNIDATGSSTTAPRIIGVTNLSSGTAARYTLGDNYNSIQTTFGGRVQLQSYWGMEIYGGRQTNTSAVAFANGSSADPSLNVYGTTAANPVLALTAAASQTGNIQEWRNSSKAALSVVTKNGSLGIGTAAPIASLHVFKTAGAALSSASVDSPIALFEGGSGTINARVIISSNWAGTGTRPESALEFWNNAYGGYPGNSASIATVSTQGNQTGSTNGSLTFLTSNNATTPTEKLRITSTGKVGIGNTTPSSLLEIGQDNSSAAITQLQVHGGAVFNNNADNNHGTQVAINTNSSINGSALTVAGTMYVGTGLKTINSSYTSNYNLWVEKGVVSENFAIAPTTDWSDYVFDKDYKLPQLSDIEQFIQKNNHLPGIPSQQEVKEKGYAMKELNKEFLEKIEQLTLYSIDQEKKIKAQDEEIKQLKGQAQDIKNIQKQLDALKKEIKGK